MMGGYDHVRYRPQFKCDPLLLTASGDYCVAMELHHDHEFMIITSKYSILSI